MTLPLADFLAQNETFLFYLDEYGVALEVIDAVHARFEQFCERFATAAPDDPWAAGRHRIRAVAGPLPGYATVDWDRPSYQDSIPLIDKGVLRVRGDDYVSPAWPASQRWVRPTSGTTGPPVPIWWTPEAGMAFHLYTSDRIAWLAGVRTAEVCRQPVFEVALVDKETLDDRVWMHPNEDRGLTARMVFDGSDATLSRLGGLLRRYRPALLNLKPNVLGALVRRADDLLAAVGDPDRGTGLRLIVSGGADLDAALRRRAERVLGVPVCDAYGMSEFGIVASECPARQGLHLYEHEVIAEVLDDAGRLDRVGGGELVLSGIGNPAMPLLRYRTGDLVEVTDESCPCGRPGRRLARLSGRRIENFVLPDGSEFAPTNFNDLFDRFPLDEFRLTLVPGPRLRAEVQLRPGGPDRAELLAAIRSHLAAPLRGLVPVDVEEAQFAGGDKFQRFRNLVTASFE